MIFNILSRFRPLLFPGFRFFAQGGDKLSFKTLYQPFNLHFFEVSAGITWAAPEWRFC